MSVTSVTSVTDLYNPQILFPTFKSTSTCYKCYKLDLGNCSGFKTYLCNA